MSDKFNSWVKCAWDFVQCVWRDVVRLGRVLWACRVSAISAVLGIVLFSFAVPAQDLFADTSWNANIFGAIAYWGAVFAAVFVIWAFPVALWRTLDIGG